MASPTATVGSWGSVTPGEDRTESHLGQGRAEEEEDGHCHHPLGGHGEGGWVGGTPDGLSCEEW